MIRLAFRLDDPSETSHQGVEAGFIEVLRRRHVRATFATIPFRNVNGDLRPLSPKRALPLKEAQRDGLIEIAQHGYLHRRHESEPARPSEFRGRPRAEQRALIDEGRRHLETIFSVRITGFVPPWNSYDTATADCLTELGFEYLSAAREMPTTRAHPLLLPKTAQLKNFEAALSEAARFEAARPIVIFVIHHYDFVESGVASAPLDLGRFDDMLGQALSRPGTRVATLAEIARDIAVNNRQIALQQYFADKRLLGHLLPRTSFLDAPLWRCTLVGLGG